MGRLEISSTNKSRQFILDARVRVSANDDKRAGVSRMLNFLFPFWEGLFSTIKTSLLSPCSSHHSPTRTPMFDTQLRHKHSYYRVEPACSHLLQASSPRPSITGTMDASVVDVQSSTSLPVATLSTYSHLPSTTSLVSQTHEHLGLEYGMFDIVVTPRT